MQQFNGLGFNRMKFNWMGFNWMECRRVRLALWDYVAERLSEETLERVERHLPHCAGCRRECDTLRHAQGFLTACRAEEEPAPRTGWAELRTRLANEVPQASNAMPNFNAPINAPTSIAGVSFNFNPDFNGDATDWERRVARAFRPMQLMTAMAGSFALIASVAVGYGITHLQPTLNAQNDPHRNMTGALVTRNETIRPVAPSLVQPFSDEKSVQTGANIMSSVVQILAATSSVAPSAPDESQPPHSQIAANGTHLQTETGNRVALSENGWAGHSRRTNKSRGSLVAKQSSKQGGIKFRPYTPKAEDRLTEGTQVASRYVLERVRPVSNDGEETSVGITPGPVQPTLADERHEY